MLKFLVCAVVVAGCLHTAAEAAEAAWTTSALTATISENGNTFMLDCSTDILVARIEVTEEGRYPGFPNLNEVDLTIIADAETAAKRLISVRSSSVDHDGYGGAAYMAFSENAKALADLAMRATDTITVQIGHPNGGDEATASLMTVTTAHAAASMLSVIDTCKDKPAAVTRDEPARHQADKSQPEQWTLGDVGGNPMAQVVAGEAALIFSCDSDVPLYIAFSVPESALKGRFPEGATVFLSYSVDGASPQLSDVTSEKLGDRLVIRFKGSLASLWADMAKRANKTIRLAFLTDTNGPTDVVVFTARGSTAAIKGLEGCARHVAEPSGAAPQTITSDQQADLTQRLATDPLTDEPAGVGGGWLDSRELFGDGEPVSFTQYANHVFSPSPPAGSDLKQKLVMSCSEGKTSLVIDTNGTVGFRETELVTIKLGEDEPSFRYLSRRSSDALDLALGADAIPFILSLKDSTRLVVRIDSKPRVEAVYNLGVVSTATREVAAMCGWIAPEGPQPCTRRPCG